MLDVPQVEFHYYKNFLALSQLSIFKKVKDLSVLQRN